MYILPYMLRGGSMTGPGATWVLAGFLVSGLDVLLCAAGRCWSYADNNGTRHSGFECRLPTSCCGDCHYRYCCSDPTKFISEQQQKKCVPLISPRMMVFMYAFLGVFVFMVILMVAFTCWRMHRMRGMMVAHPGPGMYYDGDWGYMHRRRSSSRLFR